MIRSSMFRRKSIKKRVPLVQYGRTAKGRRNKTIRYVDVHDATTTAASTATSSATGIAPGAIPDEYAAASTCTYSDVQGKKADKWEALRPHMLHCHIQEMAPPTYECVKCHEHVDDIISCEDCGANAFYCHKCCLHIHETCMLHVPFQWQESCHMYKPLSLKYTIKRLDHQQCVTRCTRQLIVIDHKARQHNVDVEVCSCEDMAVTLIRHHMWPATPTSPQTAFTFQFMELLTVLQLDAHLPAKAFTSAVAHMLSFLGLRVDTFMRKNIYRAVVGDCLGEYMLHRSTLLTKESLCEHTIGRSCPLCQQTPSLISMDGNFGLVHKKSSGEGHGGSKHNLFFADSDDVALFVDEYSTRQSGAGRVAGGEMDVDQDVHAQNCSSFKAGNNLRSKSKSARLDVTGVFGAICRHDVPLMFLDLKHGERLSYPLYILKKLLRDRPRESRAVVMYDISCTLHKHLKKTDPFDLLEQGVFVLPSFHSYAHSLTCQLNYGQRYAEGTGDCDGEGIERLWSYLRPFKKITKEMTLQNRTALLTEALIHHSVNVLYNLEYKLTTSETYALSLHTLDNLKKVELPSVKGDIDRNIVTSQIDKLEHKCASLQTKCKLPSDINSEVIHTEICSASQKQRMASLTSLRNGAADRQHLLLQLRKYADGQEIWMKINKNISMNTSKLDKELKNYNNIPDTEPITFTDITSPQSDIYHSLDTSIITAPQKQVIELEYKLKHAHEEIAIAIEDIKNMQTFLHVSAVEIKTKMETLEGHDRQTKGLHQYLSTKLFQLERIDDMIVGIDPQNLTPVLGRTLSELVHSGFTIDESDSATVNDIIDMCDDDVSDDDECDQHNHFE